MSEGNAQRGMYRRNVIEGECPGKMSQGNIRGVMSMGNVRGKFPEECPGEMLEGEMSRQNV